MNVHHITTIWQKELRDTTRDKRTLYAMVLMPVVVMPLLIYGIGKFASYQQQQAEAKTITLAVAKNQQSLAVIQAIGHQPKIKLISDYTNLEQAVKDESVDAAVSLPDNATQLQQANLAIPLTLYLKSVKDSAIQTQIRVQTAIQTYNTQLLQQRLATNKINPQFLSGATISNRDLATSQEKSGFGLAFILPLFIVMWAITGGMYTAIDASAGEKERKTLETLLLTPASRLDLVLGKFLAVASVSFTAVVLSIGSLYFTLRHLLASLTQQSGVTSAAFSQLNLSASLTPQAISLMLLISALLALLFAAILLTVGIFAKSYREAQSYISPIYILTIVPISALNAVPNLSLPSWLFLIPPVNAVLLFKEILRGVYDPLHIGATLAALCLTATIALILATRIFQQERVLFKT